MSAAQKVNYSESCGKLYLALELSNKKWKCAFSVGFGQKPRYREVPGGAIALLAKEVELAKQRFGLAPDARVASCFEIGRDGFWVHRALLAKGIENVVVESSSIEVKRQRRRAKTDRLDAGKLLTMLIRFSMGESRVWQVVNVPSVEQEDGRQLHRELMTLREDRTRLVNRIKGLLAAQGVRHNPRATFLEDLKELKQWDGRPLPEALQRRLRRDFQRLVMMDQQGREIEQERMEQLRKSSDKSVKIARKLMRYRGIGINSSWLFSHEIFAWRQIRHRRQLGSLSGLTPTPYASGETDRDQGISKAGNRWIRAMAIEIAWQWLRHQPQSKLSRWYQYRFGQGSKRQRKIGIVALARKLLIALWRYLETGQVPEGAILTDWKTKLTYKTGLAKRSR